MSTRRVEPVPAALRAVIALCGVGLAVVPSPVSHVWLVLTIVAGSACAARPATVGALMPTAAFVIGWLAAGGWDATPDTWRTIVAAALLYVLHQASALASLLPLDGLVAPGVLRRWVLGALPALAVAAVVVALDLLVSRGPGSPLVELVALVAILVIAGVVLRPVLLPGRAVPTDRRDLLERQT